ncbi:alpha/beta fold hydrolase [Catellatospora chokoriensis]|uniref:alpha/beta fold hydrolase n=1 Tax=Catellatospora chokoriensis TaxID=310353 RepID=UPI001EF29EE2|nr:alpha/beta hydrolase [Catellatospora chokoriensis]
MTLGILLTSTVSATASTTVDDMKTTLDSRIAGAKPTVVLVHGGFADASASWNPVIKRLQKNGYPVVAPANPLRGLPTDVAYLKSVLDSVKGPIVLVGHSYGGAVITNAAAGDSDVKALVYIAAFMPDKGERLGELIGKFPGSEIQAALNPVQFPNPDGTTGTELYLQPDKLRAVFAADLPESTTMLMASTQRPFSASSFEDVTQEAAWHTIPSWALIARQDKAIPAELERYEAKRANSKTVEVDGSHVAMVSRPDVTTNLIIAAATATA